MSGSPSRTCSSRSPPRPRGRYVGVAPDADLVAVVLESRVWALASSANVIDAVGYVLEKAAEIGQRGVVNLSEGALAGLSCSSPGASRTQGRG